MYTCVDEVCVYDLYMRERESVCVGLHIYVHMCRLAMFGMFMKCQDEVFVYVCMCVCV